MEITKIKNQSSSYNFYFKEKIVLISIGENRSPAFKGGNENVILFKEYYEQKIGGYFDSNYYYSSYILCFKYYN